MEPDGRRYWDKHAKDYDRSMWLLGRPIPRMVELAGEATRGLACVLEVAAGTGLVTPALAAGAGQVIATDDGRANRCTPCKDAFTSVALFERPLVPIVDFARGRAVLAKGAKRS